MFMKKLSMLFFILGTLIAIFSGVFQVADDMATIVITIMLFLGSFIAYFNVDIEQETKFLIATIAAMVSIKLLVNLFTNYSTFNLFIEPVIMNFIYFISGAAFLVAIKVILRTASEGDYEIDEEDIKLYKKEENNLFGRIWDLVVFIAVAIVFILFILETIFKIDQYENVINIIEILIWIIFIVDLFFLYERSIGLKDFLKNGWLDIIAAVPPIGVIGQFAKVAKLARMIKIATLFSKISKVEKIAKISRAGKMLNGTQLSKYFSKESGFNKILTEDEMRKTVKKEINSDIKKKNNKHKLVKRKSKIKK